MMLKSLIHILLFAILLTGCSEQSKTTSSTSELDYSSAAMWYSHKENTGAEVDVFYVTPTCIWDWTDSMGAVHHQMDVKNQMQRASVDGSNALANALFSKSCRFYSPYYRQISMESWMQPKEEIEQRYKLAHKDVVKAFNYYMSHHNQGRPFILAGHSQGAKAALELLKYTISEEQHKQMVAIYMFGFQIKQSDLDNHKLIKPAKDSLDCGVVVCYNSVSRPDAASSLFKENVVCINPINWRTDATYAAAIENLGSVFFREDGGSDTLFCKVGAKIEPIIQTLFIDGLNDEHYFIPSIAKLFPKGNYHVQEINLYFLNLQKNIEQRIRAFKQRNN